MSTLQLNAMNSCTNQAILLQQETINRLIEVNLLLAEKVEKLTKTVMILQAASSMKVKGINAQTDCSSLAGCSLLLCPKPTGIALSGGLLLSGALCNLRERKKAFDLQATAPLVPRLPRMTDDL
jgi:hypothetical protein